MEPSSDAIAIVSINQLTIIPTFDGFVECLFNIHPWNNKEFKPSGAILLVKVLLNPSCSRGVSNASSNVIAGEEKLVSGMRADIAVRASDEDKGALGDSEVLSLSGHDV